MPIFLTTGTPGSFKTISTIGRVIKRQADDRKAGLDRPVYACNIKNLSLPGWEHLEHGYDWPTVPDGAIVIIDECQKEEMGFGRMSTTAKVPPHIALLEDHRHRGIDIYLITQGPHLINSHIKPLVDTHWHMVRKYGWDRANVYQSTGIIKNPETKSNLSDTEKSIYRPDKKLYQYYDSATLHTVKKRVPKAISYGVPALLICLLAVYMGFRIVYGMAGKEALESAPDTPTAAQIASPSSGNAFIPPDASEGQTSGFDPMTAYIPRIAAMPETAPAYDELRKPQDFPRPQCLQNRKTGDCQCYSQQATLLRDYPQTLCLAYVNEGYFDPTKPRNQANRPVPDNQALSPTQDVMSQSQDYQSVPKYYVRSDGVAIVEP